MLDMFITALIVKSVMEAGKMIDKNTREKEEVAAAREQARANFEASFFNNDVEEFNK